MLTSSSKTCQNIVTRLGPRRASVLVVAVGYVINFVMWTPMLRMVCMFPKNDFDSLYYFPLTASIFPVVG